jgi:hypothetical protein
MRKTLFSALALSALAIAAPASAQEGVKGQWSVSFKGGVAQSLSGDVHLGGTGTVLGLPTSVQPRSYDEVYDLGYGFRAGLGYGVARNVEVFGDFTWGKSEASILSVGNVAGLDLRAQFADYKTYGFEGGLRFHLAPESTLAPYLSLVGGFKSIDAIPATFTVPAANVTLRDTPFYDKSTVPVFGSDLGLLINTGSRLAFGVEAGVRYHTKLTDLEGLAGTGLESINDTGDRWSFPVVGTVKLRF